MNQALKQFTQRAIIMVLGQKNTERLKFYRAHGRFPNLDAPQTFSEKTSWRKFNDHDPRMTVMADKFAVKPIVAAMIGEDHIIPTYGVYDRAEDVPLEWDCPVVVKATHASGANLFLRTPGDKRGAVQKLREFLSYDHATRAQEWAYRDIQPRLIVEPMMLVDGQPPPDFKFHVFGGKVFSIQVDADRFSGHRRSFFSRNWELQTFSLHYPFGGPMDSPSSLGQMIYFAELIGGQFSYARVDFYDYMQRAIFGEITFYPGGGYERFDPPEMDLVFGRQWPCNLARGG